jgi:hypothetical protein
MIVITSRPHRRVNPCKFACFNFIGRRHEASNCFEYDLQILAPLQAIVRTLKRTRRFSTPAGSSPFDRNAQSLRRLENRVWLPTSLFSDRFQIHCSGQFDQIAFGSA